MPINGGKEGNQTIYDSLYGMENLKSHKEDEDTIILLKIRKVNDGSETLRNSDRQIGISLSLIEETLARGRIWNRGEIVDQRAPIVSQMKEKYVAMVFMQELRSRAGKINSSLMIEMIGYMIDVAVKEEEVRFGEI